jgi:hypothetical protein
MKPENTQMKLVFTWLVSDSKFLLPGELNLLETIHCMLRWLQHIGKNTDFFRIQNKRVEKNL